MTSICCGQKWDDPNVPHYCTLTESITETSSSDNSSKNTSKNTVIVPNLSAARSEKRGTSENIQVFVRIRPFVGRESDFSATQEIDSIVHPVGSDALEVKSSGAARTLHCTYDAVFDVRTTQEEVYDKVRDCTTAVLNGFNSTLFAYGQTGSGKSYTMFGDEDDLSKFKAPKKGKIMSSSAGIIPRAIHEIFSSLSKNTCIYVSFMQIYNENIYDLLRDTAMDRPLSIHEDTTSGLYVQDLSEYAVRNATDCLALLQCGEENRAVRCTHMNQVSSRSHSVFQLFLEKKDETAKRTTRSKLNLVDLAGSEKWNLDVDLKNAHISEMNKINLSLHTLGRCISALATKVLFFKF